MGRTSGLVFLISLTGLLYVSDLKIKLFILAFYVAIANTLQQNYVNFEKMIDWAFELFVSFIFHGRIRSESLSDLTENMLFIPNINQILIGDGLYSDVNTVYYLGTDSGYLRPVLFGGILTLVILIAPYTYVLKHYHFKKSMIVRRPYVIYPFMLAAIIQVKGEVFLSGTMSNVLVILYLAYYSVEVVCEDEGFPNQD